VASIADSILGFWAQTLGIFETIRIQQLRLAWFQSLAAMFQPIRMNSRRHSRKGWLGAFIDRPLAAISGG
jgi:hypothetical protein